MTRGGVDEGRCKPEDTHDDGADDHPNVEPANLLGVCAPLGLLPSGAPWSCLRGGYHFLPQVNECPARQREGFSVIRSESPDIQASLTGGIAEHYGQSFLIL